MCVLKRGTLGVGHCCRRYRNTSNLDLTHKATTHADTKGTTLKKEKENALVLLNGLNHLGEGRELLVFVPKLFFNSIYYIFHGWPLDPRTNNSLIALYKE